MGYTSATLYSPEQVSAITGIGTATLANWRSRGDGPGWLKVGRKIWYPVVEFEAWMEGLKVATQRTRREMALAIPGSGPKVLRSNRFGRHRTKQDEGRAGRGLITSPGGGWQSRTAEAGGSIVQ